MSPKSRRKKHNQLVSVCDRGGPKIRKYGSPLTSLLAFRWNAQSAHLILGADAAYHCPERNAVRSRSVRNITLLNSKIYADPVRGKGQNSLANCELH